MDGNGRWAEKRGQHRLEGHRQGVATVERVVRYAKDLGISYLTLYAFSAENWQRPEEEVQGLMILLREFLRFKLPTLLEQGVRLRTIGDSSRLPAETRETLEETIRETEKGSGITLTLALSYGGRDEIVRAIRRATEQGETAWSVETFSRHLDTHFLPDPDLVIRTSGEYRISNFLLWQSAYAEFIFTETLWPDFSERDLDSAVEEFKRRERRFGRTSGQRGDF